MFFKPNEQPTEPRWLSVAPTGVTHRPLQGTAMEVTGFPLKAAQHVELCWWDGSHPPRRSGQPQNHRALLIPCLLHTM